jgi:sulfur-carrier protein
MTSTVHVALPAPLRTLAALPGDVAVAVDGPVTLGAVLDALEARHPVLRGTIRDRATGRRRPFVRFFACEEDLSHEAPTVVLPEAVATGAEPLVVLGAMAGG